MERIVSTGRPAAGARGYDEGQAAWLAARLGPETMAHPRGRLLHAFCLERGLAPVGVEAAPVASPAPVPESGEKPLSLDAVLERDTKLFSLPEIYARLDALLKDPNATAADATDLISSDPALSATLLRLVNSAFMGRALGPMGQRLGNKVESLERAVLITGTSQLASLALGLSVAPAFKGISPQAMDMRRFWEHSVSCAILTRGMAQATGWADPEQCFVCGLLHDIGKLVMFRHLPAASARCLARARAPGTDLTAIEREEVGFDHALLGGRLLAKWRLPETIERAVTAHHAPEPSDKAAMLVNAADLMAQLLAPADRQDMPLPRFNPAVWEALEPDFSDLESLAQDHAEQFEGVIACFFSA
ncbi:Ribonuclease Y [Fundidesulfovibrio magnetotacticus]|uniref:Ribonuclease Y n=1 Tax=Fundidesulfovibrio magnetotacticus TaxID=2730080 RepID=A0A6V8M159_9BACT|nr:HDOD domain-containing protein [Fundidesulfovibrio magnetotacticus]GFK95969.1 Ribonuclease Y [Fundidesulfovibrio magnetotacticus]